jgi:hypothetical protein
MDCRAEPLGEVAVSLEQGVLFTSGGGFSENNAAPFFQAADVASYLQRAAAAGLLPPATVFNASGRAYPDVSTVGHNLMIVSQGQVAAVDGTSASAPVFAALVSLLNSATIARGSPPLGFLNPLLYYAASAAPGSLYDVTVGANRCGAYGWTPTCCAQAFTALPGFDPVAGLGELSERASVRATPLTQAAPPQARPTLSCLTSSSARLTRGAAFERRREPRFIANLSRTRARSLSLFVCVRVLRARAPA